MPLAFEQNPKRFQHIALIISNKDPAHRLTLNRESDAVSIPTTVAAAVSAAEIVALLAFCHVESRGRGKTSLDISEIVRD